MRFNDEVPGPLSEGGALAELDRLFEELTSELKELREAKLAPELMQATVCANVMALSFGLGSILRGVRRLTRAIWKKLRQLLGNYWGQLSTLLLSLQLSLPKLKEWKLEFKGGVNPSVTLSLTFNP